MSLLSKIALGLAGIFGHQVIKAQTNLNLETYRQEQTNLQRKGMYVLAGWSAANMLTGAYYSSRTESTTKYFHRMNLYWNAVNGLLSGVAIYRLSKSNRSPASFAAIHKQQQSIEKTLLLNAGLDIAYITAGAWLVERSKNNIGKRNQYKGYGNSVMMQGGFLLLFDGILYSILHHKGKELDKMLEKIQVSPASNGASLVINL